MDIFIKLKRLTKSTRNKLKLAYNKKDLDALVDIIQADILERNLMLKEWIRNNIKYKNKSNQSF